MRKQQNALKTSKLCSWTATYITRYVEHDHLLLVTNEIEYQPVLTTCMLLVSVFIFFFDTSCFEKGEGFVPRFNWRHKWSLTCCDNKWRHSLYCTSILLAKFLGIVYTDPEWPNVRAKKIQGQLCSTTPLSLSKLTYLEVWASAWAWMFVGCALVSSLSFNIFLQNTGMKRELQLYPLFPLLREICGHMVRRTVPRDSEGKGLLFHHESNFY